MLWEPLKRPALWRLSLDDLPEFFRVIERVKGRLKVVPQAERVADLVECDGAEDLSPELLINLLRLKAPKRLRLTNDCAVQALTHKDIVTLKEVSAFLSSRVKLGRSEEVLCGEAAESWVVEESMTSKLAPSSPTLAYR